MTLVRRLWMIGFGMAVCWSGAAQAADLTPQQIYERDAPGVLMLRPR